MPSDTTEQDVNPGPGVTKTVNQAAGLSTTWVDNTGTTIEKPDGTPLALGGGSGATGPAGPPGSQGEDGADGDIGPPGTSGPAGAPGTPGTPGSVGAQGPVGPMGLTGEDGLDGDIGPPGVLGAQGASGSPGAQGQVGAAIFYETEAPEDPPPPIPGPAGPSGAAGSTGSQGAIGPALYFEADGAEDPEPRIPGPSGPAGAAGTTGSQGPAGPALYYEADGAEDPEPRIPGPTGPVGPPLGFAGGQTANVTINDTVTYTTGGVTLALQTANVGSVWRVRARGQFVAVTSATARNAQVAAFWGSAQLTAITVVVLVSVAQATNWELEFLLTGSSTTAIWTAGSLQNKIDYPAIVAGTSAANKLDLATPASVSVTAGPQTIDLRFSMSVAVATDQWVVQAVTIERLE